MKAAEIEYRDAEERYLDFHSLRRTACTWTIIHGKASMRETMEFMRHSDANMSMKVYADVAQLNLAEVVENMPKLSGDDAPNDAPADLKFGEIPPLTPEILETIGTEFLWPVSRDPVEFVKAFLHLRPPNKSEEDDLEALEAAGVPVRSRT